MSRRSLYIFLSAFSLAGYAWVGWNLANPGDTSTGVCLFRAVTHIPCPSCGSTRAVTSLIYGDMGSSLRENPLGLVMLIGLIAIPLWLVVDLLRKDDTLHRAFLRTEELLRRKLSISVLLAVLLALNWAWNIMKAM